MARRCAGCLLPAGDPPEWDETRSGNGVHRSGQRGVQMPQYRYKARDKQGALQTGVLEAARREAAADQLSAGGLIPVLIEERTEPVNLTLQFSRVRPQDLIIFSRQLATLMSAGISFTQSLASLERQTEQPRLRQAVADVRRDVEAGATFSESLEKHPRIFDRMYVSMIRAGESAGMLDAVLNRLAILTEKEAETRARVKAAVRYPLIVVFAICGAFAFLMSVVVPRFAGIFSRFKTQLPLPTRILLGINFVVQHYWYLILGVVILGLWGVRKYVRTPAGRRRWDGLKLRLPVFGVLFQKVALSRFARVFSGLQKSGMPVVATLEIVADTVDNTVITEVIQNMSESLRQGKNLREPMEASGRFPPLVIQMVAVGEETGDLDTMLNKVADYYDMDVEYAIRNLSTMIEPILLLFIGGLVLLLALGIFLPMWDVMNLFRK